MLYSTVAVKESLMDIVKHALGKHRYTSAEIEKHTDGTQEIRICRGLKVVKRYKSIKWFYKMLGRFKNK